MMSNDCSLVPRPKQVKCQAGVFRLCSRTSIVHTGAVPAGPMARLLAERLAETAGIIMPVRSGLSRSAGAGVVEIRAVRQLRAVPDQKEGYEIEITAGHVVVSAAGATGLQYGVQSLISLLIRQAGNWVWPACLVRDWPDFAWRGLLVDPARKFIPLDRILDHINQLARAKMNVLHVHFTDNESFTLESKRFPGLNERLWHPMFYGTPRGSFTLKDLRQAEQSYAGVYTRGDVEAMVRHGKDRGVHILPEISVPSHAATIIRAFPELGCRVDKGAASETVLCIGNEQTYQVLEQLIEEFAPLFPYPVLHAGADEIDCRDILYGHELFYAQRWDHCAVCRSRMKREGLATVRQLFYYFVRRVHKMLAKHGKRCMIWNDFIDISRPVDLPRDILIHYWQIAMKNRGPREGCSFAKFLKAGFEVVNSNSRDTYIDEPQLMKERDLLKWNPAAKPFSPPALRGQILGGELCAWADHGHYVRTVPPGLAVFADRVWNRNPIDDVPAYARAATRHLFGPARPVGLQDVFARFGAIIPSRSSSRRIAAADMTMPEHVLTARRDWRRLARQLRQARRNKRLSNRPLLDDLRRSAELMASSKGEK